MKEKSIFLTFDDGPQESSTFEILDILKEFNVKASFFVLGKNAEKFPQILKRMKSEGHLIGNHTYSHSKILTFFGLLNKEIEKTNEIINDIIGQKPKFFRPPFGFLIPWQRKYLEKKGYKVIFWDIDSKDWRKIPAKKIIEIVFKKLKENSIILFHESKETAISLPFIIKSLKERNFIFKTVEQKIQ